MTTIAYKDGIIAADTQATELGIKGYFRKIFVLPNQTVIAGAGDLNSIYIILPYLGGEVDVPPKLKKKEKDWELFIYRDKHLYTCTGDLRSFVPVYDLAWALGSGWMLALAAMKGGATAEQAVKVAGELDTDTNTIVDTYNIKTKKLTLAPFPK